MFDVHASEPPCGGDECRELIDNLVHALDHRDVIGMAKGIIMATTDCGPEEAFERLVCESRDRNIKLWRIAGFYVSRHVNRAAQSVPH